MQKVISLVVCAIIYFSCISCRHSMKAADYVGYIGNKENGLIKTVQVDGWEYCMQYKPYDYIILLENKDHASNYDPEKRRAELKGSAWFNISIKRMDNSITPLRYGISSVEEYNSRLNYYLNEAQKDIKLVYGRDTLSPVSYLFENNYNLTPQETIVVGFYLPKGESYPQQDMRLSLVDRVFKNGIINARYSSKTLKNIPTLIY